VTLRLPWDLYRLRGVWIRRLRRRGSFLRLLRCREVVGWFLVQVWVPLGRDLQGWDLLDQGFNLLEAVAHRGLHLGLHLNLFQLQLPSKLIHLFIRHLFVLDQPLSQSSSLRLFVRRRLLSPLMTLCRTVLAVDGRLL
jgi:hypothetical protein